jgi:ATP synthase protein I|nr:AtpZ/AtpI family protein [uncultured Lachnoclostridium sp.]
MKNKSSVVKGILMVSQIGISMLVPIFLCVFVGRKLDDWLGTSYITLIGLVLGIMAAFRNIYIMTKSFYAKDKAREDAELSRLDEMKKERERRKKEGTYETKETEYKS